MIIIDINRLDLTVYIKMIIGAIFCQVNKINLFIQFRPSIISGNQKCNGAAPNFKHMVVLIIK